MAEIQNIPINEKLSISNPKINKNFQNLNNEIAINKTDADNKLEAHKNSTTAHPAQNIVYSGVAPGDNAEDAITNTYKRISEIVSHSGNDITEIVDARGGFPVLGDRLNASDKVLNDLVKNGTALFDPINYGAKGDGVSDDSVYIQAALDAAELVGGGIIVNRPGVFLIEKPVQIPSNVVFYSTRDTIFKRNSNINVCFLNKSNGTTGGYGANENISIIGGTFDGNNNSFPGENTLLAFGHCTNIVVRDVTFLKPAVWHSLELNAVINCIVEGCVFDGYSQSGTEQLQIDIPTEASFPWFGPWDLTPCSNITIQNNIFKDGIDGIGSHTSAFGVYHSQVNILRNRFDNMTGVCIKALNYKHLSVVGNFIKNVHRAITISAHDGDSSENFSIVENTIFEVTKTGTSRAIAIERGNHKGSITGNFIKNVSRHGIGIDFSVDWVVSDNRVSLCGGNGIWSYASAAVIVKDNIATGSTSYDIISGFDANNRTNKNSIISNICDKMSNVFTDNSIISLNQISSSWNFSDNIGTQRINNYVGGTWTP